MDEAYWEMMTRWHLYRRWRKPTPKKRAVIYFRQALRRAPKNSVAIDCGANVGDVTALMLKEGLRVTAFEPDPTALSRLTDRFLGHERLTVIPKAVGAYARYAPFYRRSGIADGDVAATIASSFFHMPHHATEPVLSVEIIDLVRFIQDLDKPVAVLKIDIEGAEIEVLEAILDAKLHESMGHIFVETHERLSKELASRTSSIRARIEQCNIHNICLDWS